MRIQTLLSEHRRDEARTAIEQARAALSGADEETVELRHRLEVTLAQLRAEQGDTDAALGTLQEMVRADANDVLAWRALVQVLAQQKRSAEAIALLEEALTRDEAPAELGALVAELHSAAGDEAAAETALRGFVERSDSPAAVVPLVEFLSERDRTEDLLAALDEALRRFPDEARLRLLRTEALLEADRTEEARAESGRFAEATFEGDPQNQYLGARAAQLRIAWRLESGGPDRLREALDLSEDLVAFQEEPDTVLQRARAAARAGFTSPAVAELDTVSSALLARSRSAGRGPTARAVLELWSELPTDGASAESRERMKKLERLVGLAP